LYLYVNVPVVPVVKYFLIATKRCQVTKSRYGQKKEHSRNIGNLIAGEDIRKRRKPEVP